MLRCSSLRAGVMLSVLIALIAVSGCESQRSAPPPGSSVVRVSSADLLDEVRARDTEITVVNLWATWCAPCVEEFPDIVRSVSAYDSTRVSLMFVSVDFDEQIPEMLTFLRQQKWHGPAYFKQEKDNAFVNGLDSLWTGAVPATFVFARSGALKWFHEGKLAADSLSAAIDEAL